MPKSAVDSAVDRLPVWILRLIPGGVKDFVKRLLEMNAVSAPLPTGNPPPEVAAIRWFHRIDLGNGVATPGADDTPLKLKHLQLPESLSGKRSWTSGLGTVSFPSRPKSNVALEHPSVSPKHVNGRIVLHAWK